MSETKEQDERRFQLATTIPEPTQDQIRYLVQRGYTKTQIATLGVDKLFWEQVKQEELMKGQTG